MTSKNDVEAFLEELRMKLKIWGLLFRSDRGKNAQTLLDLELTIVQVKEIVRGLEVEDFVEGPIPDTLNLGAPLWVFGKYIKSLEIYIKITLGRPNAEAICISFHRAEYPMKFPFRA